MCAGTSCFTKAVFGPVQRFRGGVREGPIGLILVSWVDFSQLLDWEFSCFLFVGPNKENQ